jgi:hypothetical protein
VDAEDAEEIQVLVGRDSGFGAERLVPVRAWKE